MAHPRTGQGMKTLKYIFLLVMIISGVLFFAPQYVQEKAPEPIAVPALSHAQETWIRALEWCESRGNPYAVNPEDADGTPSYGSWQFKPETFWYYAEKYDVEPLYAASAIQEVEDPSDRFFHLRRDNQYQVLKAMVLHREEIRWTSQFPGCVKKLGPPPA